MSELTLLSIHCAKQEDFVGSDEPYITIDKKVVWGPTKMKRGDTVDLRRIGPIYFDRKGIELELYEKDLGGPDPDDKLGSLKIDWQSVFNSNGKNLEVVFTGDDANYKITYSLFEPS